MNDTRTRSEKISDAIAKFGGSWSFIIIFFSFLGFWMLYNSKYLSTGTFDPYPFILLNLLLSCLAAIQAPIIMMSQNRQSAKDREKADKDLDLSFEHKKQLQKIKELLDKYELDKP